jgi:hypothetical protein
VAAESIFGLVVSAIGLAKTAREGIAAVRRQFPEYERFWKTFERSLEPEHDIPREAIRSHCYLQPEFIGMVIALVNGEDEARALMEAHFESFVEPPRGAREDKSTIVGRIMRAAEDAANAAARDERVAGRANRRLIEGRVAAAKQEILGALGNLGAGIEEIHATLSEISTRQGEVSERDRQLLERAVDQLGQIAAASASPVRGSLDRAELEKLLERNTARIERSHEETLQRYFGASEPGSRSAQVRTAATADVSSTPRSRDKKDHVAELRREDSEAAERLAELINTGGPFAIARALRDGQFDDGPLTLLVAAARIASEEGFFAEAEQAYLRATRLDLDDRTKARQFVRAARLSRVQGSQERFRRHLDAAREVAPDHPALAIAEARATTDAQFMLDRLRRGA